MKQTLSNLILDSSETSSSEVAQFSTLNPLLNVSETSVVKTRSPSLINLCLPLFRYQLQLSVRVKSVTSSEWEQESTNRTWGDDADRILHKTWSLINICIRLSLVLLMLTSLCGSLVLVKRKLGINVFPEIDFPDESVANFLCPNVPQPLLSQDKAFDSKLP